MEFTEDGIEAGLETVTAEAEDAGTRADVFLAAKLGVSRSNMQKLLEDGRVKRGEKIIKANYKVRAGEMFVVDIPEPEPIEAVPENIPLDIIYEDDDVVVLNKARGMVVHPAPGNYTGTLVNALLYHCSNLSGINSAIRPGIVHRLDKDTSGIMIVAKNDAAHISLSQQIQSKNAVRTYLAVVRGNIKTDSGTIETQIARDKTDRKKMAVVKEGGRDAITDYEVLERFGKYTLVRCKLRTPFGIKGQALHSHTLEFTHPRTGERMKFEAPLPEDMHKIITRLHNGQF